MQIFEVHFTHSSCNNVGVCVSLCVDGGFSIEQRTHNSQFIRYFPRGNLSQVGLPLLSLDGMAVRQVKQWILRCSACFRTCTEMGRLFCPVCGNAGLSRVACSVNAKSGAMRVHLRKNYKVNLRGTKYSIPHVNPSKGRFEGDILLREDQLLSGIWAQKVRVNVVAKKSNLPSVIGSKLQGYCAHTPKMNTHVIFPPYATFFFFLYHGM